MSATNASVLGTEQARLDPHPSTPSGLLRRIKPSYLGMALFWATSMMTFRQSTLYDAGADLITYSTALLLTSFAFNIATILLLAIRNAHQPGWCDRLPGGAFALAVIGGMLLLTFSGHTPSGVLLFFAGAALLGIGYGFFWSAWADVYARMRPDLTSVIAPLCYILTLVIYLAMGLVFEKFTVLHDYAALCLIPLPVLSWLALEKCRGAYPESYGPQPATNYVAAFGSIRQFLLGASVLSFIFGFMWETVMTSTGSVVQAHFAPLLVTLPVAVVMFAFVLFGRRKWNMELAYRWSVPIVICAMALTPVFWGHQPVMVYAFLNAGFGVFEILLWSMPIHAAYDWRVPGSVVAGMGRVVFLITRLAGILAGYFIMLMSDQVPLMILVVIVFVTYLIATWLWYARAKEKGDDPLGAPQIPEDAHERISQAVEDQAARMVAQEESTGVMTAQVAGATASPIAGMPNAATALPAARVTGTSPTIPATAASHSVPDDPMEPMEPMAPSRDGACADATRPGEEVRHRARFKDCCDEVARKYNLTQREAEILPYLAQGRSARVIAESLYVSENTVRTHIKHILEKTSVPTKQGLIDFVRTRGE